MVNRASGAPSARSSRVLSVCNCSQLENLAARSGTFSEMICDKKVVMRALSSSARKMNQ